MSQSQYASALVSVRLVVMDHYMANPVNSLDPLVSDFRGTQVRKVPVLRVFGSTPAGQTCCLHLHGIFPYMYVPMPRGEGQGFVYRLATSLDKAINISMNQGNSGIQHVYRALEVSGRPMYGYHPRQHNFVKIFFYNPAMVKRAAELLAGGAVMNQVLQPHESHVPASLQFMMDYNLQGMNFIHLRHVLFRRGQLKDEYDDIEPFLDVKRSSQNVPLHNPQGLNASCHSQSVQSLLDVEPAERKFHLEDLSDSLKLPAEVGRQAVTELELDAVAADVLNHNDLSEGGMNPGLKVLWEEERERRVRLGMEESLEAPSSPPRPREANQASQSELFWKERLEQALARRKEIEGVGQVSSRKDESLDPDSTLNMSSTVESGRGGGHPRVHQGSAGPSEMRSRTQSGEESQKARVYPSESSEEQERLLPPATQLEHHVAGLSLTQIDSSMLSNSMMVEEERDDLDDTVVDEVVASQMNASLPFLDNEDEELIDLLGDLAEDAEEDSLEPSCSPSSSTARPTTPSQKLSQLSQATPRSGTKSATPLRTPRESQNHPRVLEEEDDDETLEMSQVVWDVDPRTTEETEAALLDAAEEDEEDEDWGALDRTVMEELARGFDDNATDPDREESTLSQTVIDDMEDMFA